MSYFESALLAFIEGLTEFLPISSTGHLIVVSAFLGLNEDAFVKSFNIVIQFGAILSVLVLYWRRFFPIRRLFYLKLFMAFLPAAVIGLMVKSHIDRLLGSTSVVAVALVLGGVVLLFIDRIFEKNESQRKTVEGMSIRDCLIIGFFQCLAFVPGVSRAASTIIGGQVVGLTRKEAAEFSFFLAVPTISGAAVVKASSLVGSMNSDQIGLLLLGLVLSFVFAALAIRFFIGIVSRFGLKYFGWYRIVLGVVVYIAIV